MTRQDCAICGGPKADHGWNPDAHAFEPSVRCERAYCPRPATHLASRIDARRDWFYGCETHAREWHSTRAAEVSALPPLDERSKRVGLGLPLVLAWWPPKHRAVTRQDAERILENLPENRA